MFALGFTYNFYDVEVVYFCSFFFFEDFYFKRMLNFLKALSVLVEIIMYFSSCVLMWCSVVVEFFPMLKHSQCQE